MPNKKSGFTLIELLVVITVIGVLSGVLLGVINSTGVRAKARDSQRKADLNKIQIALETYFADNRSYPTSGAAGLGGWEHLNAADDDGSPTVGVLEGGGYINPVPLDPSENSNLNGPCESPENYRYSYRSDGSYYYLTAIMEITTSKDDSPCTDIASFPCAPFTTQDVCYVAQNP
jgi:prepilin-type N-terminal cleavage/methylation domain-containing protein